MIDKIYDLGELDINQIRELKNVDLTIQAGLKGDELRKASQGKVKRRRKKAEEEETTCDISKDLKRQWTVIGDHDILLPATLPE